MYQGSKQLLVTLLQLTASYGLAVKASDVMHLHLLNNTDISGAVCLDGSPGGFMYSPAKNANSATKWQIYFQGGGWCYDKEDCYGRSSTGLGSSTHWAQNGTLNGIVSANCDVNPDFCNFHRVWIVYCDGNSFSGNRDDAVVVNGKPLYFRGRRILDETLKSLSEHFGMDQAETVMLTGCSAGGLATYLHTDYVHEQLQTMWSKKLHTFKAAAISGFFLQHKTVENQPVYAEEMKNIYELANSTHGLNADCINSFKKEDQWQCNFAQHAYAHTKSLTFPLNSGLDSWQTQCIYTSELVPSFPQQNVTDNGHCAVVPGWTSCAKDPEQCNSTQMDTMNQYITDFQSIMSSTDTYDRPGNGAFIHSCHTHCEAQSDDYFQGFTVNGVTMQQAVSKWWHSDGSDDAKEHTYTPCQYKTKEGTKHMCNPSCAVAQAE
jgi:hypothetical protein